MVERDGQFTADTHSLEDLVHFKDTGDPSRVGQYCNIIATMQWLLGYAISILQTFSHVSNIAYMQYIAEYHHISQAIPYV